MSPHKLFSVFIRLIGIWKLAEAIDFSVSLFNVSSGASRTDLMSATSYTNHVVASAAIGLVLLLGGSLIASFFYSPTGAQTDRAQG